MKELRSLKALFYLIPALVMMSGFPVSLAAQEHNTTHQETSQTTGQEAHADSTSASHGTDMHGDTAHEAHACHFHGDVEETEYDATSTAFHHISYANVYSIGSFNCPLPCILYAKGHGWDVFSSGKFNFDFFGHGEGRTAYNQYVLDAGAVKRIQDASFPSGEIALEGFIHVNKVVDGENKGISYACDQGKHYLL